MAAGEDTAMAPFLNFLGLGAAIAGAVALDAGLRANDSATVGFALAVFVVGVGVVCLRW
jgi:hypothetical protein